MMSADEFERPIVGQESATSTLASFLDSNI
jgi:hypothetical protein